MDIAILLVLTLGAFVPLMIFTNNAQASTAQIKSWGKVIKTVNLAQNQTFTVNHEGEINTVQVQNGKIRVSYANCENQIDVKAGWKSRNGQTIVCLPHNLVITLVGTGPVKEDGKVVDYQ